MSNTNTALNSKWEITREFARWTVLSALRSGAPVKKRTSVYEILDYINDDLEELFDRKRGPISPEQFDAWHKTTVGKMVDFQPNLNFGWAAKMVAIYLKTSCYLAGFGRDGLGRAIHPPIDNVVIAKIHKMQSKLQGLTGIPTPHKFAIKSMDQHMYDTVIDACRSVAAHKEWTLFEVERLWTL